MLAEVFNEEVISLILESSIKIIVLILGTLAVTIMNKYKLENRVKDLVWYAEQIYEKEGMGRFKKDEVISYFSKKTKLSEKKLKEILIIMEKEVMKLNLIKTLETPETLVEIKKL